MSEQLSMFGTTDRYPSAPGIKQRGSTSERAAEKIKPKVAGLRAEVLALFRELGPSTPDEIAQAYARRHGMTDVRAMMRIRPRCSELGPDKFNMIAPIPGQTRPSPITGGAQEVLRVRP